MFPFLSEVEILTVPQLSKEIRFTLTGDDGWATTLCHLRFHMNGPYTWHQFTDRLKTQFRVTRVLHNYARINGDVPEDVVKSSQPWDRVEEMEKTHGLSFPDALRDFYRFYDKSSYPIFAQWECRKRIRHRPGPLPEATLDILQQKHLLRSNMENFGTRLYGARLRLSCTPKILPLAPSVVLLGVAQHSSHKDHDFIYHILLDLAGDITGVKGAVFGHDVFINSDRSEFFLQYSCKISDYLSYATPDVLLADFSKSTKQYLGCGFAQSPNNSQLLAPSFLDFLESIWCQWMSELVLLQHSETEYWCPEYPYVVSTQS